MKKVKVLARSLNVRRKAGLNEAIVGSLKEGDIVVVSETISGWHRIDRGWISMEFTEPVQAFPAVINRDRFFTELRKSLFRTIQNSQIEGMKAILDEWEQWVASGWVDNDGRKLAYILATSCHETGRRMQPVEEIGKGRGKDYGRKLKMGKGPGRRIPYNTPDKIYYGRGDVQLTWYENYKAMGDILKIDLLTNPELALNNKISKEILFEGMLEGVSLRGDFTGRHLGQYFNDRTDDPVGARAIINGADRAEDIASIHREFLRCLS